LAFFTSLQDNKHHDLTGLNMRFVLKTEFKIDQTAFAAWAPPYSPLKDSTTLSRLQSRLDERAPGFFRSLRTSFNERLDKQQQEQAVYI
jgi:hypothetical protein